MPEDGFFIGETDFSEDADETGASGCLTGDDESFLEIFFSASDFLFSGSSCFFTSGFFSA